MDTLAIIGATYLYQVPLLVVVILFLRAPRHDQWRMARYALIVLPLAFVMSRIVSQVYYDPRPFVSDGLVPLIPHVADNGFPSDHTLLVAAVAAALLPVRSRISWFIAGGAVLVGVARVAVHVHHPIDVLGSIIIAYAALGAARIFYGSRA